VRTGDRTDTDGNDAASSAAGRALPVACATVLLYITHFIITTIIIIYYIVWRRQLIMRGNDGDNDINCSERGVGEQQRLIILNETTADENAARQCARRRILFRNDIIYFFTILVFLEWDEAAQGLRRWPLIMIVI